ncbi:MAG: hypothetical protein S4CHLAM123_06490 [Chlamydiales bacterium]|nr:hypothetical protein [Chlamydiales bacterium]
MDANKVTNNNKSVNDNWSEKTKVCGRNLAIKKIAIITIGLINLACLGTVLYCLVAFTLVPTQAVIIAPFIVGVLGVLAYLKFPTFGIASESYANLLDPFQAIAQTLTFFSFGPLMLTIKMIDLTPYNDPFKANAISTTLEKENFETVYQTHGKHFKNLTKYGFIPLENSKDFLKLKEEYIPLKRELEFYKVESTEEDITRICSEVKYGQFEQRWMELRARIQFPHPEQPELDFSKFFTRMKLKLREFFVLGKTTSPPQTTAS